MDNGKSLMNKTKINSQLSIPVAPRGCQVEYLFIFIVKSEEV